MILDYPQSPTGRIIVPEKTVMPLMPVKAGFGFQGVLTETDDRKLVQCHICGGWFSTLSKHITGTHKVTKEAYTDIYGLPYKAGLISGDYGIKRSAIGYKVYSKHGHKLKMTEEIRQMGSEALKKYNPTKKSFYQNLKGTCPEQIKRRVRDYIEKYMQLPTLSGVGSRAETGRTLCELLRARFGSVNNGFKHYGLPTRINYGSLLEYTFPDGEVAVYNCVAPGYSRERIYQKVREKCPNFFKR